MNEENERKNEDRAAFTSLENKSRIKRNIGIATVLLLILILIFTLAIFVLNTYFDIDSIIVDGTDKYSYLEICENLGFEEGDIIFFVSEKKVEENLMRVFPFIASVEIVKNYPSSINIIIYEENPLFYVRGDGEYYVLTNELKVLERYESLPDLTAACPELKELKSPEIYKIIAPEKVVFKNPRDLRYLREFLVELSSWEGFAKTDHIDISEKFDITIEYDGRITIMFGNRYDLEDKLNIASAMISSYPENAQGIFDISNVEESIARMTDAPDNEENAE